MISIIDHIEYLVTEYDCVIIPGWGALIAQYNHAYINRNVFMPPSRTLSFNASVDHNDGLLANSIVRRDDIPYETALSIINDEINSLRLQLREGNEVAFGRIGFFTLNEENAICFEPFINSFDRNDFFGLASLTVIPLNEIIKDEIEDNNGSGKKEDVVYVPISRNIFKIAASIILLIGLSVVLSTPVVIEQEQDYASLSPVTLVNNTQGNNGQAVLPDINGELFISLPMEPKTNDASIENSMPERRIEEEVPVKKEVVSIEDENTEHAKKISIFNSDENDNYFLIVASLYTRELAERHIAKYDNGSMHILEKDGKYRIYIASSQDHNTLAKITNQVKSEFPGAWICSK